MLKIGEKQYRFAAWVVLLFLTIVAACTFRDYGVTWDEELQSQYGLAVVDYYLSLFQDHRYADIFNLYLYGGMFDGFASIFDRFTPFTLYETRHLANAGFGLLGLWGTWRLGRLMGGGAVGLAALLMLSAVPMFYGHMFNNPKDIPFAAGIVWSLYYFGRYFALRPNVPRHVLIRLGIILGLTLGVRVGGVMLFAFACAVLGLDMLCNERRQLWKAIQREFLHFVLPVGLIAYAVMLFCWPWAQQNPVANPLRALSEFSNFPQDVEVLLDGTTYRSTQLPWNYVPLYFGVQLPEFLLILLGASLAVLPLAWKKMERPRQMLLLTMVMMGLFPVAYAVLRHPALYDAVRHFLFVVPLACVVSALTLQHVMSGSLALCRNQGQRCGVMSLFVLLSFAILGIQADLMYRLHPYEYIYVNRFAGGVAGAYGRYELDYWGSSFKEAAARLQKLVASEGGVPIGKIYKIAICGPWSAAMIYLPPDYEPVIANEPAEFFLSTTRWECQNMRPGKDVIEVRRMGAPLAVIKDLRSGYEHYEGNENK